MSCVASQEIPLGQISSLQARDRKRVLSLAAGQGLPPPLLTGLPTTSRICCWRPAGEDLLNLQRREHADHAVHFFSLHSSLHIPTLQLFRDSTMGHDLPPSLACMTTLRVRVVVPPPHALLQVLHLAHSLTAQSRGQGWSLQGSLAESCGHSVPSSPAAMWTSLVACM